MARRIYTIGHSTRTADELIALLGGHGVDLVVDVRSFPRSRRHPQFNIETLPALLEEHGIGYCHAVGLGGRRGRSMADDASPNGSWREPGFRYFADYALTAPFRAALASLLDLAASTYPAVMCAEAVWWRCHRRIISDYLLVQGAEVLHILGEGPPQPATLTPAAAPQPDGSIHYPL